jgi:hypothetical protein
VDLTFPPHLAAGSSSECQTQNSTGTHIFWWSGRYWPDHRLCRKLAAAGLRQRNPDQSDLEPGFYSNAGQSGLAPIFPGKSYLPPGGDDSLVNS